MISSLLRDALGTWGTGIVARVEHRGELVYEEAFGRTRADDFAQPVYVDTRFDLASITKLFVSTVALALVDEGSLALDEPVLDRGITLRMLLAHTSGMNSGADYRTLFDSNVESFALTRDLLAQPGQKVVYSDLGMIALGHVIERTMNCSLTHAVARYFPSGSLGYVPTAKERRAIPATEEEAWRGRVQGVVHDEKAYLMNGVAGHAGMFGAAIDVAALADVYLAAAAGRDPRLLSVKRATEAIAEQAYDPVLRRGLGWALKTTDQNSCGRYLSMETFGHTGFTGTCVWADPERDLCGVLLTNSVYYGRNDSWPLRAAFFESIVELI